MAAAFDPWEKDPLFSAAEEVQESADRMQSIYRLWIQERTSSSTPSSSLSQDLQTTLGTAKWQLEELERAVGLSSEENSVSKSTKSRRDQFISAIRNQISTVEDSLKQSSFNHGQRSLSWVQLNEGERDELALFLSGPSEEQGNEQEKVSDLQRFGPSKNWAASANSDNEDLKITVSSEDDNSQTIMGGQPSFLPPRMLSFSGPTSSPFHSKVSRYWNGFRKWKDARGNVTKETLPLQDQRLNRRTNGCYEGSKSCLSTCADEACDKELNGWVGAIQRQLQRSQYQIQYGRPMQMVTWSLLAVLLIAVIVLCSR